MKNITGTISLQTTHILDTKLHTELDLVLLKKSSMDIFSQLCNIEIFAPMRSELDTRLSVPLNILLRNE